MSVCDLCRAGFVRLKQKTAACCSQTTQNESGESEPKQSCRQKTKTVSWKRLESSEGNCRVWWYSSVHLCEQWLTHTSSHVIQIKKLWGSLWGHIHKTCMKTGLANSLYLLNIHRRVKAALLFSNQNRTYPKLELYFMSRLFNRWNTPTLFCRHRLPTHSGLAGLPAAASSPDLIHCHWWYQADSSAQFNKWPLCLVKSIQSQSLTIGPKWWWYHKHIQ